MPKIKKTALELKNFYLKNEVEVYKKYEIEIPKRLQVQKRLEVEIQKLQIKIKTLKYKNSIVLKEIQNEVSKTIK
jgi:hypothetical protein